MEQPDSLQTPPETPSTDAVQGKMPLIPYWALVTFIFILVFGFFTAAYFNSLWPFGGLLPSLPQNEIKPLGSAGPAQQDELGNPLVPSGQSETSDWKTYTNEEYGFEFKYPGDWQRVQNASTLIYLEKEILPLPDKYNYKCAIATSSRKNVRAKDESIESWFNRQVPTEGFPPRIHMPISIDGREGIKGIWGNIGSSASVNVYLPVADTDILIYSIGCGDDGSEKAKLGNIEFENILSTFKFTK